MLEAWYKLRPSNYGLTASIFYYRDTGAQHCAHLVPWARHWVAHHFRVARLYADRGYDWENPEQLLNAVFYAREARCYEWWSTP